MSIRTVIDEFTATGNNQHGTPLLTEGSWENITYLLGIPDFSSSGSLDFDLQLSNGTWLQGVVANVVSGLPQGIGFSTGLSIKLGELISVLGLPTGTIIQAIRADIDIASISSPIYVQIQAED